MTRLHPSILLLDVGNSRLKWAVAKGARLGAVRALAHHGQPATALRRLAVPEVGSIWLAHVVGPHEKQLRATLASRFGRMPHVARTEKECGGLRVAYADPARLGVDRWLAMLALWTAARRPFCVAVAGTALTFDAVDARGRHQGGLIAPGLGTAWSAVKGATRFALRPKPDAYTRGLGTDTDACVRQGTLYACAGLLDKAAAGARGRRYLGGGDARTLAPHLDGRWMLTENLVLEGLLAYAREHHREDA
jgi:type III pantothenate kinase